MKTQKIGEMYDQLVWYLLIWCVLQDIVLSMFLKISNMVSLTKIIFFCKDILLIILFLWVILKQKLPAKYMVGCIIYCAILIIHTVTTLVRHDIVNITSFLSSVRGLILLPTLTVIGYGIYDKQKFLNKIKKYYYFLVIIAFVGLIEFICDRIVGTKTFWMDFLELEDYYVAIKGQPGGLENGTPGNWYTDIGKGYRTQKRLISVWAAPLTAGFVLLLPSLYYTINFLKNRKISLLKFRKNYLIELIGLIICIIALILTFTRQTLLPYLAIAIFAVLYYNKKNRIIFASIGIFILLIAICIMQEKIIDYIYNGSTMVHIIRIKEALANINFWGSGIGSFGTRFQGSIATESQYITVIGQLGVLSIIPYVFIFLYPILYCKKKAKYVDDKAKPFIVSLCFSGLTFLAAGIVSETVAAFTSIAQYYVLIGFAWGYCINIKETNYNEQSNQSDSNVSATIS